MALGINTNVASLNAQNQLGKSQSMNDQALQRLSSGLRINSAKDDAAGMAISTRFQSQISGLNVATRNANDGISLAQTAEGALDEITNNLQRIRELAVQSANATNSASDRAALDAEVQERIKEIDRISTQTAFNGLKVLDGSFGNSSFQVGANAGETIDINLSQGTRAGQMGSIVDRTGADVGTGGALTGDLSIKVGNGEAVTVGVSSAGGEAGQAADSAFAYAEAINSAGVGGLSVEAKNEEVVGSIAAAVAGSNADGDTYDLSINGVVVESGYDFTDGNIATADLVQKINAVSGESGVTAKYDQTASEITLTSVDGRDIQVEETITDGGGGTAVTAAGAFGAATGAGNNVDDTYKGELTFTAAETVTLAGGERGNIGFAGETALTVDQKTLSDVKVDNVANANDAIRRMDSALTTVNSLRGDLGAIQNRFESTIANLSTSVENLSASNSRILDADFAAETANLAKSQVLQQAGISVLAQANARPQQVLSLLQ
ncbi:flagellin [Marinobacter sp. 1-3A]|uniref:flagellin N-terminal helical domain-containing protein n=1 Tax=Marinobacter sp. 1-3A TaxID=2582920 RepID=UPI0019030A27|nr:flagellin [Marinobacter sp. 1-3A]MBK1872160.1 flagellin [Marinobacter sp. 1-3A]